MKKIWQAGMLLCVLGSLTACAGHRGKYNQQYYWQHAQVISPVVVPSDISVKSALGYYPAPQVDVGGDHRPPSLIPPGSKIEYYKQVDKMKNRGKL